LQVLEIIKKRTGKGHMVGQTDEIDIDIDALDTHILHELHRYVDGVFNPLAARARGGGASRGSGGGADGRNGADIVSDFNHADDAKSAGGGSDGGGAGGDGGGAAWSRPPHPAPAAAARAHCPNPSAVPAPAAAAHENGQKNAENIEEAVCGFLSDILGASNEAPSDKKGPGPDPDPEEAEPKGEVAGRDGLRERLTGLLRRACGGDARLLGRGLRAAMLGGVDWGTVALEAGGLEVEDVALLSLSNVGPGERDRMRREAENRLSRAEVAASSKPCPGAQPGGAVCGVPSMREGGCNTVGCTVCGSAWCWECGTLKAHKGRPGQPAAEIVRTAELVTSLQVRPRRRLLRRNGRTTSAAGR
jgi:hypothetical protein